MRAQEYLHRETVWTKALGLGGSMGVLYLLGTWAKYRAAKGNATPALWPDLVGTAAGVGAVVTSLYTRRPYLHELLEGGGYGLTGGTGLMIAASTTTIGNVAPGTVPLQFMLPAASGTSTPAGAAHDRAADVAANRPSADGAAGGGGNRRGRVLAGFGGIGG